MPSILRRPDPFNARSWFVHVSVEDYLLYGNAIAYTTVRGADGWPLAVTWLPASWVYITWMPGNFQSIMYTYLGQVLDAENVIHVKPRRRPELPGPRRRRGRGIRVVARSGGNGGRLRALDAGRRGRAFGGHHHAAGDVDSGRSRRRRKRHGWRSSPARTASRPSCRTVPR